MKVNLDEKLVKLKLNFGIFFLAEVRTACLTRSLC